MVLNYCKFFLSLFVYKYKVFYKAKSDKNKTIDCEKLKFVLPLN